MSRIAVVLTVCFMLSGFATYTPAAGQELDSKPDGRKLRVGTFDSRLIATAYVRSEAFKQRLSKMHADLKDAKAAGDKKRIKQLETKGSALQELIHKQGFSTWPVHDILQTIKDELPGIAKQAHVDLIVSKWDVAFQRTGADTVDVTDLLVTPFDPDEETQKVLESLRKKAPVPLNQLKNYK